MESFISPFSHWQNFREVLKGKVSQLMSLIFAVLWFEQSLFICYLLLGEAYLERRIQVPSDLLLDYLARYLSAFSCT